MLIDGHAHTHAHARAHTHTQYPLCRRQFYGCVQSLASAVDLVGLRAFTATEYDEDLSAELAGLLAPLASKEVSSIDSVSGLLLSGRSIERPF